MYWCPGWKKMMSEMAGRPNPISVSEYCQLATRPVTGHGYSRLPDELLQAERACQRADESSVAGVNRGLCRSLLDAFSLAGSAWVFPKTFRPLYQAQLERIEYNLKTGDDTYFSLQHDAFIKDLAILRHRLIPFGAELATPYSGISRSLLIRGGWRQSGKFMRVISRCGGIQPFLELHLHSQCTAAFHPEGWIETYENLADFLTLNLSLRGVQSTSWFMDPALEQISPHLAYLRQVPEAGGASILYAGKADPHSCGALDASATRRTLYTAGHYQPRLYTRIWSRQDLLRRLWRSINQANKGRLARTMKE
jgi:hypothetical protein